MGILGRRYKPKPAPTDGAELLRRQLASVDPVLRCLALEAKKVGSGIIVHFPAKQATKAAEILGSRKHPSPGNRGRSALAGGMTPCHCAWCSRAFAPRATGGKPQVFCRPACRRSFDAAGRRWIAAAIAARTLTPDQLRNGPRTTRALPTGAISRLGGNPSPPMKPPLDSYLPSLRAREEESRRTYPAWLTVATPRRRRIIIGNLFDGALLLIFGWTVLDLLRVLLAFLLLQL